MRSIKLLIAVVLLISFVVIPVYAATDIQNKANSLNQLNLLKGDGSDYNLNGQLRRSEASTFIVRLLGKENHVLENKENYIYTIFSDVKPTDWYAPYVGYCVEQGILTGFTDGRFAPNDYISEKSFLKMVLCALGYAYGVDFTWSDVYQTAYSEGLVKDPSYAGKVADNSQYKRGLVVDAMYNSLNIENKISKIKQIDVLINEGAITKSQAVAAGIFSDDVPTSIALITVVDKNKISIKFSENIKPISTDDIYIYETMDLSKRLTVNVESLLNNELVLKTSDQAPERGYTIELMNVVDLQGNATLNISGTFNGYRNPELKSDFFKISKIECTSKNMLKLYFTHPVNINSEIASNYEIYQNDVLFERGSSQTMTVKLLGTVDNAVMITLKDKTFTDGAQYVLKVSGALSSAYGVKLNEMQGDSIRFSGKALENAEFQMINIEPINNRTLQLDFNMELNPTIAQQVFSYYLTDSAGIPIRINKAVISGDGERQGKSVLLTLDMILEKTKAYSIMINNVNDISRQFSITEKSYSFYGSYPDKSDIKILNATPTDAGTIAVFFDRPLDKTSAEIPSNFNIIGITHGGYLSVPVKTYYDAVTNPYLIKLFLPADRQLDGTKTYKLRVIPSLLDHMGYSSSQILEYGFNGNGSTTAKPVMSDAVIISPDAIKVTFNKEIAMDLPNLLNTNYSLENDENGAKIKRIPSSVTFYNATTIILRFDSLEYDKKYTLSFDALKDYSGINTRTKTDGSNSLDVRLGK